MASKKTIQELADIHGVKVAFEFGNAGGEFGGETRLTLPEGKLTADGSTGYTVIADGSTYSTHLTAVMQDLRELIRFYLT